MIKKSIRHFSKGMVIGLEIVGAVGFVVFLGWCGLLWRLSQGPLNVDFLTVRLERALNEQQAGFIFDVGATQLTWGGNFEPIDIEMEHVEIKRGDNTPVVAIEKIGVQVSKRNIIFGRIVPKVIKVYSPALRIVRAEDNRFALNLSDATDVPEAAAKEDKDKVESHATLVKNLLRQLDENPSYLLLGGLEEIRVSNAALFYEDRVLNVAWRARKSDIVLARGKNGLAATVIAGIDMGEAREAIVRGNVLYSWRSQETSAEIYFGNLVPAGLVQQSKTFADLSGVDLALKGKVSAKLDFDFKLGLTEFIVGADPGKFNARGLYAEPIDVQGFYMAGQYDGKNKTGAIDQLKVNLGGPVVQAQIKLLEAEEGGRAIVVRANLDRMPIDDLRKFWPESLTPDPRAWVTQHLSKGVADRATLNAELLYAPDAEKTLNVRKLGGEIAFHGIKVDYFPPLMPVLEASGKATYDPLSFNLDIAGGKLGDMEISSSVIHITGLDKPEAHARIDIASKVRGPIKTALFLLDSKPLEYPTKLGLKPATVGGNAVVDVSFKFPLHKALELEEVEVKAKAKLDGVRLDDVVSGLSLTQGVMDLDFAEAAVKVGGNGKLGAMPIEFDWSKYFSPKADVSASVSAKLAFDAAALKSFGVPDDLAFSGAAPSTITYTLAHDESAKLTIKSDLKNASFSLPLVGYKKAAGAVGELGLSLQIAKGKLQKVKDMRLVTDDAALSGDVSLSAKTDGGYAISKATFSEARLGNTKVSMTLSEMPGGGYDIDLKGSSLDVSPLFTGSDKPGNDAEAAQKVDPLKLRLAVDRLITGKDKYVDKVKLYLHRNEWKRFKQLEVDGSAGGKPLSLKYIPVAQGSSLRFEAQNAGAALRALGFSSAVRGGKLVVNGQPNPKSGPRDMTGTAILTDFTLKDVPVLAKLLNAISLVGIVDLLNGSGIAFKKARANFVWLDRGPPSSTDNMRFIKIKNGQTSGASLGLTFEGNIDNWKQVYDLNGTIIPVSDLSNLISEIPLVGDVLTAGGEGMFAATYRIKGPKSQPEVTVNPLAALAPGVLRKVFFEN